ncbi:RagB/SusD family nutrient uptake outer membrane protein [Pedobacter glucosidilyticus]|uniref:RagB/SusD family nutrient uptake outer membrane protein n=1 Tax=Pedobacter glucosidilyticus TaxID=1122941 RepID=UPI000417B748|nr:RagB/SusD family nutrient uptake outer membrane protein [Pedobacter glucosidilyticus]
MRRFNTYLTILLALLLSSCGQEFLDIKRDKRQVIPQTITQLQALLDNSNEMNLTGSAVLNVVGGEEYTVTSSVWNLLPAAVERNAYIWAADVYEGSEGEDWNNAYRKVLYANTALDGIEKISPAANEQQAWNNVKGSALFIRSFAFYQLLQTYAKAYNKQTASTDLGIPLRLEADITIPVRRASIEACYQQVIGDLQQAASLLPQQAANKLRPSKSAAHALLAKIYLSQQEYLPAKTYADSCIQSGAGLLDYNTLNTSLRYVFSNLRFGEGNPEVLYYQTIPGRTIVNATRFILNPQLYQLYDDADIRKAAFFFLSAGAYSFKGSYSGAYAFFCGLALDEIMLIRAECNARLNELQAALTDLNELRKKRYRTLNYSNYNTTSQLQLLIKIQEERRKQLLCRGIRWEDLRRYNKETQFSTILERNINGQAYQLAPESPRYVWPIPDEVITASGIAQNPR